MTLPKKNRAVLFAKRLFFRRLTNSESQSRNNEVEMCALFTKGEETMSRYLVLGLSSIPLFVVALILSNKFGWNFNIVGGVVVIGGMFLIDTLLFQNKKEKPHK